jgi:pimeloyl-ACP methyl ester carboxylesterase
MMMRACLRYYQKFVMRPLAAIADVCYIFLMNTYKRWILGFLAVSLIGFVLLNVLAYNHAYTMMHFTRGGSRTNKPEKLSVTQRIKVLITGINLPRPGTKRQLTDLALDAQHLQIKIPDGITLGAWYVNRGHTTPLIILFHGYGAEKSDLLQEARIFLALGNSVLLIDFRGSGESSESYTTIGFKESDDVTAALNYARETLHHSAVILYGQSMGAAAILRSTAQAAHMPEGVIIEAVFDSMLHTVRNRFSAMGIPSFPSAELLVFWGGIQTGFNAFTLNPATYAQSLECPSLFMHGSDDPRAKIKEGRRVFDAVPGPKQFKEFPVIGHEPYVSRYPAEWASTIKTFLTRISAIPE